MCFSSRQKDVVPCRRYGDIVEKVVDENGIYMLESQVEEKRRNEEKGDLVPQAR